MSTVFAFILPVAVAQDLWVNRSMSFRLLLLTTLIVLSSSKTFAYDFAGQLDMQVVDVQGHELGQGISFKLREHYELEDKTEDSLELFPVGTIFKASFVEHRDVRRMSRNEIVKAKIYEADLPNGSSVSMNQVIKIQKAYKHRYSLMGGRAALRLAGYIVGLTVDVVTLGLPIARGGMGLWEAGHAVHSAEAEESKLKEGAKGFAKGALYPLPQLVLKGKELNVSEGDMVYLREVDSDDDYTNAYIFVDKV